jgi:hypothetical protein
MGLKSAKYGVKSQLRERFPRAFREFPSLSDARDAARATRETTTVVVDGNVLLQSVGAGVTTLDGFVAVLHHGLRQTLATALLTVIVFDEPAHMTAAKREEQQRRDAARASTAILCSADISCTPADDAYTLDDIARVPDVHDLVHNRAARSRFIDSVAVGIHARLQQQIDGWKRSGFLGGFVVFDGVDARGGDRPVGEPRVAGLLSSDPALAELLARDEPIGEGDLKIALIGRRIRELSRTPDNPLTGVALNIANTIDTDSIAIELIEECARGELPVTPTNTLLCMRERAKKREFEEDTPATYLAVDVAMLQTLIQQKLWGLSSKPSAHLQRCAITLLVAGWAAAGCDFVTVKNARADVTFDAVGEIVRTQTNALEQMGHAWGGVRENVHLLHAPLRMMMKACASRILDIPRIKKDNIENVLHPDDVTLGRLSWVAAYWNGHEIRGDLSDFGFCASYNVVD